MLNRLIPVVARLRHSHPALFAWLVRTGKRLFGRRMGVYPRVLGNELSAVKAVLRGSQWNMTYGKGLAHERLEAEFAEFVGVPHAVAVGSGGMALQMSFRALGVRPGTEVVHQVDTCAATAMAVMNAGGAPVFGDIDRQTFMLDSAQLDADIGERTKVLVATHSWGNPERIEALHALAQRRGIALVEDACQALGAKVAGRSAGAWGTTGVYSFGCIKPIQGGEGGMIVTSDESLARELRSMRHWGDRTLDFGERDATQLAFNGRMSEIVAAVVREQLRGYPRHLAELRERAEVFRRFIEPIPGLRMVLGSAATAAETACTQVSIEIDPQRFALSKQQLWDALERQGVMLWHGNFEPIPSLSFFSRGTWREWIGPDQHERLARNYGAAFANARMVYERTGIGLQRMNFLSRQNLAHLQRAFDAILRDSKR